MKKRRYKTILKIALPIIGGMTSQNILNLIDTAMVGSLGNAALAGVGIASFTSFMCTAIVMGLATGVQAIAARRLGEGKESETAISLNGGLFVAAIFSIPVSLILFSLVPSLFPYLVSDPQVIEQGTPYLQARLLAMLAIGINFSFRGFWNGINMSQIYMRTLILMHVSNVVISYILIFGKLGFPAMGTLGAGIGTTISLYIGSLYYFFLGFKEARSRGFLKKWCGHSTIRDIVKLAIPSGLQSFFFATGFTILFKIIGLIGTQELAAANVLINIMLVAILPGIALGITAASLVGQALGREDRSDAKRWGWDTSLVSLLVVSVISLPMIFMPEILLSAFIHDPETIQMARLPLIITGLTLNIDTVGMVLMNALHGSGDSKISMYVSTSLQWLLFLPAAFLIASYSEFGLLGVWIAMITYRSLHAGVFAWIWKGPRWGHVRV